MYVKWGKRLFDIIFSIIVLVFLAPLMIFISILIYLFDSKIIFFKQKRIGKNGKIFLMYKFRSMPVKTKNIPSHRIKKVQISRIGSIIRRTNIDELPQFFNILQNKMSIVGPRPCIQLDNRLIAYRKKNKSFYCKPGLTGLAQVNSYNGMSLKKKAFFDGLYTKKITLWSDLKIIFKTFIYLFKPPPIY